MDWRGVLQSFAVAVAAALGAAFAAWALSRIERVRLIFSGTKGWLPGAASGAVAAVAILALAFVFAPGISGLSGTILAIGFVRYAPEGQIPEIVLVAGSGVSGERVTAGGWYRIDVAPPIHAPYQVIVGSNLCYYHVTLGDVETTFFTVESIFDGVSNEATKCFVNDDLTADNNDDAFWFIILRGN